LDFEILKAQWEDLAVWKKLLIITGISIGLAYLVYMFILSDKIKEKENLQNDIQNLNIQLETIKRNASPEKRAKLQQELEKEREKTEMLKLELEDVKAKFKPTDDAQTTLVFITDTVRNNNLILNKFIIKGIKDVYLVYNPETKRIEYKNNQSSSGSNENSLVPKNPLDRKKKEKKEQKTVYTSSVHLKRVDMSASIVGSTSGIIKFIKDVSYSKNYVRIEHIRLSKGGKIGILTADVELSAYYSPEIYNKADLDSKGIDLKSLCYLKDIYIKCNKIAKSRKILKNINECSKLSETIAKDEKEDIKKKVNSACFAGCIEENKFIKNLEKVCK